ncbi:hypothetical protein GCM10027445_67890 [Amycolatopsis endophytica]|uniref:Uncharacterized protein n=1 Tax=Amycolatopsis endophytica TaxID=860233 RepID=A0A853AVK7_9PSEU|nr:hypothetical protein [Amycolatopsis endophytica]NYI86700.1 hypothetical protein [Amycolatopsis endophytica]
MSENQAVTAPKTESKTRRWTQRGIALGLLTAPMLALVGGQASAAELTPIAEYLDATVAGVSSSLVEALAVLLGVS